jgi:hypothetical protein
MESKMKPIKNGEFKIEKGIPVPKKAAWKAMARTMDFGDSVFAKTNSERNLIAQGIRLIGAKVVQRKDGNGWRLWKLKPDPD